MDLETFDTTTLERIKAVYSSDTIHIVGGLSALELKFFSKKFRRIVIYEWRSREYQYISKLITSSKIELIHLDYDFNVPTNMEEIESIYFSHLRTNVMTIFLWIMQLLKGSQQCQLVTTSTQLWEEDTAIFQGKLVQGASVPVFQYTINNTFMMEFEVSHVEEIYFNR